MRKAAEMDVASTGPDLPLPFALLLVPRNTRKPGRVAHINLPVLLVLGGRRLGQVADAVPGLDAVPMVDVMLGPASIGLGRENTLIASSCPVA